MIGDWSTSVCHESNLLQIWLNHTNCPLCLIGDCVHGIFNTAILYFVSGCAVRRLAPSVFSMLLQHKYSCVTNIVLIPNILCCGFPHQQKRFRCYKYNVCSAFIFKSSFWQTLSDFQSVLNVKNMHTGLLCVCINKWIILVNIYVVHSLTLCWFIQWHLTSSFIQWHLNSWFIWHLTGWFVQWHLTSWCIQWHLTSWCIQWHLTISCTL